MNEKDIERLKWAVQMVLRDFEDNDSPHLSVAAVNAILSVEDLVLGESADIPTWVGKLEAHLAAEEEA